MTARIQPGQVLAASFDFIGLPPWGEAKPRDTGVTLVPDKGLSVTATRDLVVLAGPYIDLVKLGWGTAPLYPRDVLPEVKPARCCRRGGRGSTGARCECRQRLLEE